MKFVHKCCLNQWVQEKYGRLIYRTDFNIQDLKCPNCKYPYNYTISEARAVKPKELFQRGKMKFFDSKEKIVLFLLIVSQLIVVSYDGYQVI